jgi:hypothetical protein
LRAANLNTAQEIELDLGDNNLEEAFPPPHESFGLFDIDILGIDTLPSQQDPSFDQTLLIDPQAPLLQEPSPTHLINLGLLEQLPSFDLIDQL